MSKIFLLFKFIVILVFVVMLVISSLVFFSLVEVVNYKVIMGVGGL